MLTVTQLARQCGLSRSTILYYESLGLLKPARRNQGNYRLYGERDLLRLRQICAYRNAGLTLEDILAILERPDRDASAVLKRRLLALDAEIEMKRTHQKAILTLLQGKVKTMTKDKWTEIMSAAGFTGADMHRWHAEFERAAPDDHQKFLEYLHIESEGIGHIRKWSRGSD